MTTDNNTKPVLHIFKDLTIFDGFEVNGCKVFNDGRYVYVEPVDDSEAEFFSLYGHYDPTDFDNNVAFAMVGVDHLLDFATREEAEKAKAYFEFFRSEQLGKGA